MELVSVIIPYYKKKKFIKEALNSVYKQSYKNFEIILIYDDENKDELKYLYKITKKKNKIKIFSNGKNCGAGHSRNFGIKKSKGKFIAFLDADDYWKFNKLYNQIHFMKKNNLNISHTSYYVVNNSKKYISLRVSQNFIKMKNLITSCDIGLSTVIAKKKLLLKNNFPNIKTKEDFILWLKILKSGEKILGLKQPLSCWRKTDNSLSSDIFQKIHDGYLVYRKYLKLNILQSLFYLFFLSINSLLK